jgi:hypothetical protein
MSANSYIWSFDQFYRLQQLGSLSCRVENELSCDCPGGRHGTISCLSAYKGSQNLVFRCLRSFASKITQGSGPKIIVALLKIIVKMGQGEYRMLLCL